MEIKVPVAYTYIVLQLYTGNRDGQVEAVDLRDMGSFACEVSDVWTFLPVFVIFSQQCSLFHLLFVTVIMVCVCVCVYVCVCVCVKDVKK